ncbi:MAG: DNA-protecting protein DprA [Saprospirales bacterium]|nr:MAG: DNA-protecting protein DprA [Saprospirales bacterium]
MSEQEIINHIALSKVKGLGTRNFRRLISHFKSAEAIISSDVKEVSSVSNIGEKLAYSVKTGLDFDLAEQIYRDETEAGHQVLAYNDPTYPARLRRMADGPIVLYFKGNADLNPGRTVGVVGTRTPSPEGPILASELIKELKAYKVTTISGLAMGIDAACHKASLEENVPTIGVMGGGLDNIYPSTHRRMARQMSSAGGLLTEFTRDQKVEREHFPMRNRIIAGLSDALVVVESREKGGSMITAQLAFDYNRFVFAYPGKAFDEKSRGCNKLIKTHVASLIESCEDLVGMLNWDVEKGSQVQQGLLFSEITEEEMFIVDILREEGRVHIDKLGMLSRFRPGLLANLLLELELKGMIQSLPGKMYLLKNRRI